jgi:hypothetical protein
VCYASIGQKHWCWRRPWNITALSTHPGGRREQRQTDMSVEKCKKRYDIFKVRQRIASTCTLSLVACTVYLNSHPVASQHLPHDAGTLWRNHALEAVLPFPSYRQHGDVGRDAGGHQLGAQVSRLGATADCLPLWYPLTAQDTLHSPHVCTPGTRALWTCQRPPTQSSGTCPCHVSLLRRLASS